MEELKWGDDNHKWIRPGHLFTCGPGSYKIPSVNDIPLNFKVSLLKVNILSSYSHFFAVVVFLLGRRIRLMKFFILTVTVGGGCCTVTNLHSQWDNIN